MTTQREQPGPSPRSAGHAAAGGGPAGPGLSWTAGPGGAVVAVGARWLDWTGQEPDRALGDGWLDALHPDDAPAARAAWRAAVAAGAPFSARFRVGPGADGRYRPLVALAEPIRDEGGRPINWSGLAIPAPEAAPPPAPAPEAPSEAGDWAEDEDFAIFWIASRDGFRLASVSPSCERLLGRSVAELTGRPRRWVDLAHPDDRARVAEAYGRRASGEPVAIEYRLLRPDGSAARVRDRVLPALTRSMGDPGRIFGVLEDVGPEADAGAPAAIEPAAPADPMAELIEGIGDLFLAVDRDWRCHAVNARAAALLGTDREAMLGRGLWDLFPELTGPPREDALRDALARREAVEFEAFSEQARLWLEFRAYPVGDGLALIARDVTEARANRLALLEVEERHRLTSEAVVGLIYDWRVDSGLVHRSPGLMGLLGIPPEHAEPTNAWWRRRVHPDDLPRLDEELSGLLADRGRRHYSLEYRVRHRDGHYIDVWDRASCVRDDAGRVCRVVGTAVDVSERRRAERSAREADRVKEEFLATLAHELRNPLGPILAAAQALRARADDPEGELPAIIERQARHMSRLVEDLLDISRISHGKVLVRAEPIDLAALVRQTLGTVSDQFREAGLTLRAELPGGPVPATADPTRLSQCLGNLLHNASKFTERGGEVAVRVEADDRAACIEVRDTGIGIAPEVLPTLFHAYRQAAGTLERGRGGLGLGLALVKNLMELQGGRVEAASPGPGLGSTFRLVLPLPAGAAAPAPQGPVDAEAPRPPEPAAPAPRPLRLLVVDDRPDMAHILGRLLRAEGHRVSVAADAEQALAVARQERPEVVISDIGLPGPIDGYGLAEALRADPDTASALLIAITGYARPDDRARALRAGFDEHLTKPLDFAALCDRLARLTPRPGSDAPRA